MRSCLPPPQTMAPIRPLPSGSASTHCVAGRGYHSCNPSQPAPAGPAAGEAAPPAADVPAPMPALPRAGAAWAMAAAPAPPASAASAAAFSASRRRGSKLTRVRPDPSLDWTRDDLRGAVVAHGHIPCRFQRAVVAARAVDEAHPDLACGLHAGVGAGARTDRQLACGLIPRQRNATRLSTLVAIAATVVLVQREAAVGAGIDLDRQRRVGPLVDVLLHH